MTSKIMENEKEKIILVADYGRSGQGWLSYMLCYILNAKYIEPYDLLKGRKYSASEYIRQLTGGNLLGREKTKYSMIVKTHGYPAPDFNLTDKVILLTRDPRDVAVSFQYLSRAKKYKSLKGKIFGLINNFRIVNYLITASKWKKYAQAWKDVKYHLVRYEDLSSNAKNTLRGVLDYLEIGAGEELIAKAVEKFSFEKITGRQRGEEDPQNLEFRKGIVGDYKNHFSKLELKLFKLICGKEAKKLGYLL